MAATSNFSAENVIISTRIGTTYKVVLPDGFALAIKRLNNCKLSKRQFYSKINRLAQLRHPNLTPLLCFCMVEEEKLLVYKHMYNGTLHLLLNAVLGSLDWPTRFRICFEATKGLAWLHHGCQSPILHQNISSNVILANEDFDAHIMDFGLAWIMSSSIANESRFVNGDLGEFGYVAPKYSSTMIASLKHDVYSFSVVLMELATWQKPLETGATNEGFKDNLMIWFNLWYKKLSSIEKIFPLLASGAIDVKYVLPRVDPCVLSNDEDMSFLSYREMD
ncbi:hypothetical protein LguiA_016943 [Lonicera macranthoides]